jgi:Periplasmic binding protein-like domain
MPRPAAIPAAIPAAAPAPTAAALDLTLTTGCACEWEVARGVVDAATRLEVVTVLRHLRGVTPPATGTRPPGRPGSEVCGRLLVDVHGQAAPTPPDDRPGVVVGPGDGRGASGGTYWVDDAEAARCAGRYLAGLGHLSVAYLPGQEPGRTRDLRSAALATALARTGGRLTVLATEADTGDGLASLLARRGRPGAVVAGTEEAAFAVLRAAWTAGLRVPADLSIVGIGDTSLAVRSSPRLTMVRVPFADLGDLAARRLTGAADDPAPDIGPSLVVRASTTGPARPA